MLEMRDATFRRSGSVLLAAVSLSLECSARAELTCESTVAAGIAARLAAGIMRCTQGQVFVADFDPKIQPVQVKRLVGFLPCDRPRNPFCADDYFAYRAALWNLDATAALKRGRTFLAMLDGLEQSEAALLAGIFLHDPPLIVLERPRDGLLDAAQALHAATLPSALFITYGPSDRATLDIRAEPDLLDYRPS